MSNLWWVAKVAAPVTAMSGWLVAFSQPNQDEHRGHMPPPPPAWVAAMDLDENGEISADELSKASESLKKLDLNEDGVLDRDELRPHPGFGGPEHPRGPHGSRIGGPRAIGPGFGGPREAGPGFGGPRERGPRESGPGFKGREFAVPPIRPSEGRGLRAEPRNAAPRAFPSFEQLDTNQDGAIDKEEYQVALDRGRPERTRARGAGRKPINEKPKRGRPEAEKSTDDETETEA